MTRKSISKALKKYFSDPENRKKVSERMKKFYAEHPEARKLLSKIQKEHFQKDENYVKRFQESSRAYWENKKNRKNRSKKMLAFNEETTHKTLGNKIIKKSTVYIKVLAKDYPRIKAYNAGKYGLRNPKYKYIQESYKVWYDAGNKMPEKNEIIYHLDNNYLNNKLSNLKIISRSVISIMSKKGRHSINSLVSNSNLLLSELELKIKRKSKEEL